MIFYQEKDVALILQTSNSDAYKIIRTLKTELEAKGYLTNVKSGIQANYFQERFELSEKDCVSALQGHYLAFYGVDEVSAILRTGKAASYQAIRTLREDFEKEGFMLPKRGYIQSHYFRKRFKLSQKECQSALLQEKEAS
ncbi:MAG: hypothetical protein R3Y63_08730 [Eubacteriales bacterium]